MRRTIFLIQWLLVATCLVPCAESPPPAWYHRSFAARRQIQLPASTAKGTAVLLRTGTAGLTQPDARDVRIVLDHQYPIPFETLEVGPGDSMLLAFEVLDPARAHHLYLGSPAAQAPARPRKRPAGGLLLEVLELGEGTCDTWPEAQKLLKASTRRLGYLTPRTISLGVPPLGRRKAFIARYTGLLDVRKGGTHIFETVSEGASFVLVNRKLVASWPGFHGLEGYANPEERKKHSGKADLTPGIHPIEYIVATRTGGVHLLAMGEPGDDRTHPLSPQRFVTWPAAALGPLEAPLKPVADFDWDIASDTGADAERHDLAEVRFRFSGDLGGRLAGNAEWQYGDGQKGQGMEARHVYLKHGLYDVRVEIRLASGQVLDATRKVAARFESLDRPDLDALLDRYHEATKAYDLRALPPEHLAQLVWLRAKDERWREDLWAAIDCWYERDDTSPVPERIFKLGLERAQGLARAARAETLTRRILGAVSRSAPEEEDRDEASAWLARLDSRVAEGEAAEKALKALYEKGRKTDAIRRAGIFLANLHLGRGRKAEARAILERMESEDGFRKIDGDRRLSSGARSLSFDGLLKEKKLTEAREELERWEWELPCDRLTGILAVQWARLHVAENRLDDALGELRSIEGLDGAAHLLPRALLLEAEVLKAKGDAAGARARLERLVREFPERPESKEAAKLLEGHDPAG